MTGHPVHTAGLGQQISGPDRHLAGNTAPVRTLPSDQFALDPDDVQPSLRQRTRDSLATDA